MGGTHTPGTAAAAIGIQTFGSSLTYSKDSTFVWDLSAPGSSDTEFDQGSYDRVAAAGAVSVISGAVFKIDLAGADFSTTFWDSNRSWDDVFTGSGTAHMFNSSSTTFTTFAGTRVQVTADGTVAGQGQFYFTGSTLNWRLLSELTPIPEPGGLLALGCLVGSGLCLRTRRRGAGPQLGGGTWHGQQ